MNRTFPAIWLVLLVSGVAAAGEPLPPNTWTRVEIDWPKVLAREVEDGRWVTTDGYSDNVLRTKTGEVLIRTGIESKTLGTSPGFYTNTTVAWNVATNEARVVEISNIGGGSYGHGRLLRDFAEHETPTPRHTYDGICYVPEQDAMYQMLGANWRVGGRGADEDSKRQLEIDNLHARFNGERGTLALFGDSITVSRAFWSGLQYTRNNADAEMTRAFELVEGYMLEDCWDRRGPEYGNQGRMTIRWAHQNVDDWLKNLNPEVALIMFGTNDLGPLEVEEYATKTRQVVEKCLDNGTIVILSTIPPRHGRAEKAAVFAEAVREIARDKKVPLTDYHAEILKRRPDDWDGATEKFSRYRGYDVPTLISRDGVHPSNPGQYVNDYSAEGLRNNGYLLRSYLALMKYAEVIERVLPHRPTRKDAPRSTIFFEDFEGEGDWDGTLTDEGTPAANKHVVEGHPRDEYFGRKVRVGTGNPPAAMAKTTWLSFDYFVEGSDFLMVFLFNLDVHDNCRYPIPHPTVGKWTTHTMKVTRGGRLKAGHKVDDLFFFAGQPGSKDTRLMVDNVRLEGTRP